PPAPGCDTNRNDRAPQRVAKLERAQRRLSPILRALRSPPIRELRSAASVKESKAPPPPPLLMPPPLETTRSTAEPLATFVPADGVLADIIAALPTVRPAAVMALAAAAGVWPTTFRTAIWAGPLETTRSTAEPLATLVPADGLSLMTLPAATVLLDCIVTAPT